MLSYGRSRNFEQRGIGYKRGTVEIENHAKLQRSSTPEVCGELSFDVTDERDSSQTVPPLMC